MSGLSHCVSFLGRTTARIHTEDPPPRKFDFTLRKQKNLAERDKTTLVGRTNNVSKTRLSVYRQLLKPTKLADPPRVLCKEVAQPQPFQVVQRKSHRKHRLIWKKREKNPGDSKPTWKRAKYYAHKTRKISQDTKSNMNNNHKKKIAQQPIADIVRYLEQWRSTVVWSLRLE